MNGRLLVSGLAFLALLAACSGGAPTETPAPAVTPGARPAVFLRNATAGPLAYVAAGEGTLALIDPPPMLGPGEYAGRVVEPGSTARVTDIVGFLEGLGVGFYIYLLEPGSREARYRGYFLATAAELARNDGVVTVTRGRF